jgi:hypothetical protein
MAVGVLCFYCIWRCVDTVTYHAEFWLKKFDSSVWKVEAQSSTNRHSQRRCMIHDLTKNYLHKGMKREEVVNLLGDPRQNLSTTNTLNYWLGHPRWWFTFDHDILEIHIDSTNSVTGWKVRNT